MDKKRKCRKNWNMQRWQRPIVRKALAMLLVFVMISASSGIQVLASEDTANKAESTNEKIQDSESILEEQYETEEAMQLFASPQSTVSDYDITNLLTPDSWMKVFIGDTAYSLDYLNEHNIKIPVGARVDIQLEWDRIPGILKGQKLVYQIPKDLVSNVEEEETFPFESNNEFAGYMTLDSDGLLTVEIDDDFYDEWQAKQLTGTVELDFLTLEFYATLSDTRGHNSGNGDNEFVFKGQTTGSATDEVKFIVPFEYKNENGGVVVRKSSEFDTASQIITYTVEVEAPSTNTMTAENVVLTDVFDSACVSFLNVPNGSTTGVYQDIKVTGADGTDITNKFTKVSDTSGKIAIGDMEPGDVVKLTYKVNVKNSYFSNNLNDTHIANTATAAFNDDGEADDDDSVEIGGTVLFDKQQGSVTADGNGGYYIPYTITVYAYGGQVKDVSVEDEFSEKVRQAGAIKKIETETGSPVNGKVTINDTNGLTWYGITLNDGESTTLTYRAYLDPDAWLMDDGSSSGDTYKRSLTIRNDAYLYVGDTIYGHDYKELTVEKTWLKKSGILSGSSVNFTLSINSDLMDNNIETISDTITGGGKMTYPIKVYVYTDSAEKNQIEGSPFTITKDEMGGSDTSWTLNLTKYNGGKLKGAYHYKITYSGSGTSGQYIYNNASIGVGIGNGVTRYYKVTKTTKSATANVSKSLTSLDYVNYVGKWKVTLGSEISSGTVYNDWISSKYKSNRDYNYDITPPTDYQGYWYYSQEDLDSIIITEQQKQSNGSYKTVTIYDKANNIGVDDITISGYDAFSFTNAEDGSTGTGFKGYTITFNKDYTASTAQPMYIYYNMTINMENLYEAVRYCMNKGMMSRYTAEQLENMDVTEWFDNGYFEGGNYGMGLWNNYNLTLGNGVTSGDKSFMFNQKCTKDVLKAGKYNASDGTITWYLMVNRNGDMVDKATITDTIPAGLTVTNVEMYTYTANGVTSKGNWCANGLIPNMGTTLNSDIKGNIVGNWKDGVVKNEDGTTTLTVNLENLSGYYYNLSINGDDITYNEDIQDINRVSTQSPTWQFLGTVTIIVTTTIDNHEDQLLVGLSKTETAEDGTTTTTTEYPLSFTNNMTVDSDTMVKIAGENEASATVDCTLTSTETKLSKAMATYSSGNYVTYNMTVNSPGTDLLTNSDTLTIIDVMEDERMSLATNKSDYFVVKNTKTGTNITSQCTMTLVEDYTGKGTKYKITVPDATPIQITYKVRLNAAVGETVTPTNKAYFEYQGTELTDYAVESSNSIKIARASGTSGTSSIPYFYVYKKDQYDSPVEGAYFEVYTVKTDSSGKVVVGKDGLPELNDDLVSFGYTNSYGKAILWGKTEKESETDSYIYCIMEVSAPNGYVITNSCTYVEFYHHENSGMDELKLEVIGMDFQLQGSSDLDIVTITNEYVPAKLDIPIYKTINDQVMKTDVDFTFTLKQTKGPGSVYSDLYCTTAASSFKGTVTGSGTGYVNTVYFNQVGTYEFTLTEDEPSDTLKSKGFNEKDGTTYTISVTVAAKTGGGYEITSATYSSTDKTGNLLSGDEPSFNNTLTLKPAELTLHAIKEVTGRKVKDTTGGKLYFEVLDKGTVVSTGTVSADGGNIEFTKITYETKDLGTHNLVIREVVPTATNDVQAVGGIAYDAKSVFAVVTVSAGDDATIKTSVTYKTTNDKKYIDSKTGYPILVNSYSAQGSFTITGTKYLLEEGTKNPVTVRAGQFNFIVTEDGKQVATGTTEKGGSIVFTPISYEFSDVGTHTYIVSEVDEGEKFVEYSEDTYTVVVEVSDAGDGTLSTVVKSVNGETNVKTVSFINTYTFVVPSGISVDFIPYTIVALMAAGGLGTLLVIRRRKRRIKE